MRQPYSITTLVDAVGIFDTNKARRCPMIADTGKHDKITWVYHYFRNRFPNLKI